MQRYLFHQQNGIIDQWMDQCMGQEHTVRNNWMQAIKCFEFNVVKHEDDMTKCQRMVADANRVAAQAAQACQDKIDAMSREHRMHLDGAKARIRNLELEVHYLKSITEFKVKVDYDAIKQKNKLLNAEFKRIYKLYRRP